MKKSIDVLIFTRGIQARRAFEVTRDKLLGDLIPENLVAQSSSGLCLETEKRKIYFVSGNNATSLKKLKGYVWDYINGIENIYSDKLRAEIERRNQILTAIKPKVRFSKMT